MNSKNPHCEQATHGRGNELEDVLLTQLYHGTAVPFDSFRDPLETINDPLGCRVRNMGPAIYLTSDANGMARYFARCSVVPLAHKLLQQGERERSTAAIDSWGVVLSVELPARARILRVESAPAEIRAVFHACQKDCTSRNGQYLRDAVLAPGYDGISYPLDEFPEGWEVDVKSRCVVLFKHELARIVQCKDAAAYALARDWTVRGESGVKPQDDGGVSAPLQN